MMMRANTKEQNGAEDAPRERVSGDSIKTQIKLMVLKDPSIQARQIIDHLSKRYIAPSKFTVEGIRADLRHTLKILKENGSLFNRAMDKL